MPLDITGVASSSTALMLSTQNRRHEPLGRLYLDERSGWVKWRSYAFAEQGSIRLCWLPTDLRGFVSASHGGIFVVVSGTTQQFTVIDFTLMLKGLYESGLISLSNPSASLPTAVPVGLQLCAPSTDVLQTPALMAQSPSVLAPAPVFENAANIAAAHKRNSSALTPTEPNDPHDESNLLLSSASLSDETSTHLWSALADLSDVPLSRSDDHHLMGPATKKPRRS
jgi:hypothetical protein